MDIDTNEVVGRHHGIHMWTLGQRCRLSGHLKPYYIAVKNPETQQILVVTTFINYPFTRISFVQCI